MPFMCYSHPTGDQSIPRLAEDRNIWFDYICGTLPDLEALLFLEVGVRALKGLLGILLDLCASPK